MGSKQKQNGFSIVEVVITVVILALIGVGGLYIWNANRKVPSPITSTAAPVASNAAKPTKTFELVGGKVSFTLPSGWSGGSERSVNCAKTLESIISCLESGSVYPDDVDKVGGKPLYSISISTYSHDDSTTAKQWWENDYKGDNGTTIVSGQILNASTTPVNGYDAYNFTLDRGNNSVTEYFVVTDKSYVVLTAFDIKQPDSSTGNAKQDYSQYLNATNQFVTSIRIK